MSDVDDPTRLKTLWGPLLSEGEGDPRATYRLEAETAATLIEDTVADESAVTVMQPGPDGDVTLQEGDQASWQFASSAEADTVAEAPGVPTLAPGPSLPTASASAAPVSPATFLIDREIGRGGMGVVYRARQISLQRHVAVKKLRADRASPSLQQRFVAEAIVTARLDHPNIVAVHDLNRLGTDELLMPMKLVGGTSWRDRILEANTSLEDHIGILLTVCNAVGFAHSKGILHNDLKPENIMVGEFGEVLVMDWGIAMAFGDREDSAVRHCATMTHPCGTPCYMSPELADARGEALGPPSDVYLLGAILCELLSGKPPHQGDSVMSTVLAALDSRPPELPEDAPRELATICRKALAKAPADRHPDVASFQTALQDYLKHRESIRIAATAQELLDRSGRPVQERYGELAEAVSGFRQAQSLWAENPDAIEGYQRARLAYAGAALVGGDIGLAEAQAAALLKEPLQSEADTLRAEIASAKRERERQVRSAQLARRGLLTSVVLIGVGLMAGFVLVNRERGRAVEARDESERQRERAEDSEEQAVVAFRRAEAARASEERQRKVAEDNRRQALMQLARGLEEKAIALVERGQWGDAAVVLAGALPVEDTPRRRGLLVGALERAWRVRRLPGHQGPVPALAWSPKGDRLATGCADGKLRIWDQTGKPVRTIEAQGGVSSLAWAPAGDRLALGLSGTTRLAVWDGRSPALDLLAEPPGAAPTGEVLELAWSPQGGSLARATQDGVVVWDSQGRLVSSWREATRDLVWVSATQIVTVAPNGEMRLRDARSEDVLRTRAGATDPFLLVRCFGSPDGVYVAGSSFGGVIRLWGGGASREGSPPGIAFSRASSMAMNFPDPESFLAVGSADGGIQLWSEKAEPRVRLSGHTRRVDVLTFSPLGLQVASGARDGLVRVWDISRARTSDAFQHPAPITAIAWSPDGSRLATASADGTVRLQRPVKSVLTTLRGSYEVTLGEWQPRGDHFLSTGPGGFMVWEWVDGNPRGVITEPVNIGGNAWSPDGTLLAAGIGEQVRLWMAQAKYEPLPPLQSGQARELAWSVDGRLAVLTAGEVTVWNPLKATKLANIVGRPAPPLAWSRDGTWLAVIENGSPIIWTVGSDRKPSRLSTPSPVTCLVWSERHLATGSQSGMVVLWDPASGQRLRELGRHRGAVLDLAFSRDGSQLVSAGADGELTVWDVETSLRAATLKGHRGAVRSVRWSPDGAWLATASDDRTVGLWKTDGTFLAAFTGHSGPVRTVRWAARGDRIASASADRSVRIWRPEQYLKPVGELRTRAERHTDSRLEGVSVVPLGEGRR